MLKGWKLMYNNSAVDCFEIKRMEGEKGAGVVDGGSGVQEGESRGMGAMAEGL